MSKHLVHNIRMLSVAHFNWTLPLEIVLLLPCLYDYCSRKYLVRTDMKSFEEMVSISVSYQDNETLSSADRPNKIRFVETFKSN